MLKIYKLLIIGILLISNNCLADRIKDMASVAGVRTNQLVGYGLVIGLAKTGDGSVNLTKQSIASMISQFGVIRAGARPAVMICRRSPPGVRRAAIEGLISSRP